MWLDHLHPTIPPQIERYLATRSDEALRRVVGRPMTWAGKDWGVSGVGCLVQVAEDSQSFSGHYSVALCFDAFAIDSEYSLRGPIFRAFRSANPAISAIKARAAAILAERDAARIEQVLAERPTPEPARRALAGVRALVETR